MNRIERLQNLMTKEKIDLFWTEESVDIYYLLQFHASKGILLVTEQEVFFFVDGRYLEKASTLSSVKVLPYEKEVLQSALQNLRFSTVSFSGKKMSYDRVNELFSTYLTQKKDNWKSIDLVEILRMVKDAQEIEVIKKACTITKQAFDQIDWFQTGATEKELAQEYKKKILELGADTYAFDPIVAFDQHAAIPHHTVSSTKKDPQQQILIDVGATFGGYHGDMTKTFLLPSASDRLKEFYEITKEGYLDIFQHLEIGVTFDELLRRIHAHFQKYFVESYFLHSLGHGIGLFVHEAPFYKNHPSSRMQLQENMVFTVEPGLYDPKIGGVRLENTILITKEGPKSLTGLLF